MTQRRHPQSRAEGTRPVPDTVRDRIVGNHPRSGAVVSRVDDLPPDMPSAESLTRDMRHMAHALLEVGVDWVAAVTAEKATTNERVVEGAIRTAEDLTAVMAGLLGPAVAKGMHTERLHAAMARPPDGTAPTLSHIANVLGVLSAGVAQYVDDIRRAQQGGSSDG